MPRIARPGGARIHWQERGEGPLAVLAAYWSGHPGVYDGLMDELAADHRVVSYDARGTGESTRDGPFDMEADAADLEAVIEAAGQSAIVLSLANGCNYAVRLGARRPDLVTTVATIGTAPLWVGAFQESEGMLSSPAVIEAFLEMLARDYRGALRTLLSVTNPQMSEAELRERVAMQADYCPRETAIERVRAWVEDDPSEPAGAMGDRLWILRGQDVAGPWLPPEPALSELMARLLPRARLESVDEGPVSRPDLIVAAIRRLAATPVADRPR